MPRLRSSDDAPPGEAGPRAQGAARHRSRQEIEAFLIDLLNRSDEPLSAYTLANRATKAGHPVVANQVYRTLARLIAQGRVRRLESLSAFILVQGPADASCVCDRCHTVLCLPAAEAVTRLAGLALQLGFTPGRVILETHGRCARCGA